MKTPNTINYFSNSNQDYIKYVRSRDIREYLYDINYNVSDLQAFFLIDSCTHISYEEKIKALKQLYDDCEDTSLTISDFKEIKSLKQLLRVVTEGRVKSLAEFKDNSAKNHVYKVSIRQPHYNKIDSFYYIDHGYFTSLDSALSSVSSDDVIDYVKIEKIELGQMKPYESMVAATAYYDKKLELLGLFDNCNSYPSFTEVCIDLPVPFCKGDILTFADSYITETTNDYIVFDSTHIDHNQIRPGDDFSNNVIWYYSISLGYPFWDDYFNLYDYEYLRKPLTGDALKLKPFSLLLKEVISPGEAMHWIDCIDNQLKKQKLGDLLQQFNQDVKEHAAVEYDV